MSTTKLILLTATVLAGVLYPTSGWYRLDAFNYIHPATDIANDIGTPVYAGVYGTVIRSTWAFNGLGNYIAVRSTRINPGYLMLYAHLDTRLVSVGAMVTPWTLIGTMGTTGNTTGSHLHWEVRSADGCTLYDPIYGLSPIAANRKPWDWLCESPEINPRINPRINPSPVETTPRPTPPPGAETVRPYSGLKGDTKTWKEE